MTESMQNELVEAIGGVIYSATQEDRNPYDVARDVLGLVGEMVRRSCTPTGEAYLAGGDALIYSVADWISAAGSR